MKHQVPDCMKFKKLQRRLGTNRVVTAGTLELLWISTQKNTPRGDIGKFSNEEIAIECDWDGDPDLLVSALVESGWLDECMDNRLVVHDWEDHAPGWIKRQLGRSKQSFVTVRRLLRAPGDCLEATRNLTQPNPTQPNLKKPNQTQPNTASAVSSTCVDRVLGHYKSHHPRSKPGTKERKLISSRLKEGYSVEDLIDAIDGMHLTPHNLGENDRNTPYLGLNVAMRDSDQVARFIRNKASPPRAVSADFVKGERAGSDFLKLTSGD